MARAVGVSISSVQRIWRAHGLQPHRVRQFKLSKDPEFVDKLRDVVGLYVVGDARHVAVVAHLDVTTERGCATRNDRARHAPFDAAQMSGVGRAGTQAGL
jgi:hypothetical protein